MPKSRGRKKPKKPQTPMGTSGVMRTTTEMRDALLTQREAFRAKFGRDPGPDHPVFFDTDAPEPVSMSAVRIEAETIEAMRKAGMWGLLIGLLVLVGGGIAQIGPAGTPGASLAAADEDYGR
jgi:hypothetical protein